MKSDQIIRKSIVFLTGWFISLVVLAGNNDFVYQVSKLSHENGLPHIDVLDILEDDMGYMWFATFSGICRYDGYHILSFSESTHEINKKRCFSLKKDSSGMFWVATPGGLLLFDPGKEAFIPLAFSSEKDSSLLNSYLEINLIDSHDNLWVSIEKELYIVKAHKNTIVHSERVFSDNETKERMESMEVIEDSWGSIWIGTLGKGLYKMEYRGRNYDMPVITKHIVENLPDPFISCIEVMPDGTLYAGGYQHIYKFEGLAGSGEVLSDSFKIIEINEECFNYTLEQDVQANIRVIMDIKRDKDGNIWIATDGGLLMTDRLEEKGCSSFQLYTSALDNPYALSSENTSCLYLNSNEVLFAGTFGGGVNFINLHQKKISWLRKSQGSFQSSLSDNFIRAIEEDSTGNLWIGTQSQGISYYDLSKKKNEILEFPDPVLGLSRNKIRSLKLEKDRYLWMGTQREVLCLDVRSRKLIELPEIFSSATRIDFGFYSDIEIDSRGNLWLSTWENGTFYCVREPGNPLKFNEIINLNKRQPTPFSIPSDFCNRVILANDDNIVYITTAGGVKEVIIDDMGQIQNGRWYTSDLTQGAPQSNFVWDLVQTGENEFWIGTIGGGLYKVSFAAESSLSQQGNIRILPSGVPESFSSMDIECLLLDREQNLWIGSNSLYLYDIKQDELRMYDFDGSVFNNSFKVGAACYGRSGIIYMGGIKGINYFYPDKILPNPSKPKTGISELWVNHERIVPGKSYGEKVLLDQSICYTPELRLTYTQNNFTLVFTANLFENPNKLTYKYRLKGFDEFWRYTTGRNPEVTYTNLPYKEYEFEVISSNNDGKWDQESRVLNIRVYPPIWKSKVAFVFYFLVIALLSFFAFQNMRRYYRLKNDLFIARVEEAKKDELHQTKLQFFTNISHEFRTPLTLIMATIEDLKNMEKPLINRKKLYGSIEKNAKKLLSLVNELIEFRKLENKTIQLKTVRADLCKLIKESSEPFRRMAENQEIFFELETGDKPVYGWFDLSVLDKVLTNLLSNAFKHTPEGGMVSVRLTEGEPEAYLSKKKPGFRIGNEVKAEKYYGILVEDTGDGISEKSLPHIFDRFFQVENDPSRHLGSGIGLAIVRNFVLLHKGEIIVESERGKGTSFLIKIPGSEEIYDSEEKCKGHIPGIKHETVIPVMDDQEADIPVALDADLLKQNTIVVVEDEEEICNYLQNRLGEKFKVYAFPNAKNAIDQMEKLSPNLIISDIMMPGMDGFRFCQHLKEDMNTCHIPVILLTAKSEQEDFIQGAECGADQFITKPFSMNYLFASINNLLKNRSIIVDKVKEKGFYQLSASQKSDSDQELINRVIGIIRENLNNPKFGVGFISQELGIGRTRLYKLIKTATGLTLGEIIRDVKMKKAAQLLIEEDMNISDVASEVGISSGFFYEMFKDYYGMTPSEFQKNQVG